MKKYCFVLFVVAIVFISLLSENGYSQCIVKIMSVPETIGEKSFLNSYVELPFTHCDSGSIDITLENESTPITIERERFCFQVALHHQR